MLEGDQVITVLHAYGAKLAKTLTRNDDGSWLKASYDKAEFFDASEFPVNDIHDFSALLMALESETGACIIRGRRKLGAPESKIRRRIHDDHSRGIKAAFEERPTSWLLIDVDDLPADPGLTNRQRLDHIVDQLPPAFRDASFHYQWSSSAGLTDWCYLRCHLFFWLASPLPCQRLRDQAEAEGWVCDLALFNAAQIHYTAAPIFRNAVDPLGDARSGLIIKGDDAVSLPAWSAPQKVWTHRGFVRPDSKSFEDWLAAIGPDYHAPILRAAASYVGSHKHRTDPHRLKELLSHAIFRAIPGKNPKADYLNDRYLDRVINGAMRKFS